VPIGGLGDELLHAVTVVTSDASDALNRPIARTCLVTLPLFCAV
jgi:hypothetical protein